MQPTDWPVMMYTVVYEENEHNNIAIELRVNVAQNFRVLKYQPNC